MKTTGTSLESRKAAQANSPGVAVSRCSFTGASCQENENYPLCAADGATSLGPEEILQCCSSFPVSHGKHELWCVLNVSFPHISLRILLVFRSDYFGLTCPSSIKHFMQVLTPILHPLIPIEYRKGLTVHQYILHSRDSITSDCAKVVRRETEIQI